MGSESLVEALQHLTIVKQYATASWTLALYEYIITFDREIECIWRRQFSFVTVLWSLNRYIVQLSFFPIMIGFYIPLTDNQCTHFVKFPGVMQIIFNVSSGLTLALRVFALYQKSWWVLAVLFPPFIAEIAMESWAVAGGVPAALPKGQVGCILTGKPTQGNRFAAFWIGQLVFPSIIFVMTIARAINMRRHGFVKNGILGIMLRDGIVYFLAIFIANITNVVTYVTALEDVKFINAPFTNVITSLMICRLMLNLRCLGTRSDFDTRSMPRFTLPETYLGNLGEDLDIDNVEYLRQRSGMAKGLMRGSETPFELSTFIVSQTNDGASFG